MTENKTVKDRLEEAKGCIDAAIGDSLTTSPIVESMFLIVEAINECIEWHASEKKDILWLASADLTHGVLEAIEEKSNVVWASGVTPRGFYPTDPSGTVLNLANDKELSYGPFINESHMVSQDDFVKECIRIAPKK